ncbi:MAG: helix-turn-helix domain-containing protein [Bacteroidales bacterium]|jgi:excisionase family DNA binding protein|nr:helix-turn-helix domain-containing protein [Bacteroidales bacterium]
MNYNPFDEINQRLGQIEAKLDLFQKEKDLHETQKYLSSKEAALDLKISRAHLYRMVMNKEVPFKKFRGRLLFSREQLREFVNRNGKF